MTTKVPNTTATIRGSTRLYPVIGSPVAQVLAPTLYNPLFTESGIDAAVVPMEIEREDFSELFPKLFKMSNVCGAMITIPHKVATLDLLDDYSDAVRISGSCNAVVRRPDGSLYGEMFDGVGFVRALKKQGFVIQASRCLVVGAGGAGAAIAAALANEQADSVRLFDTSSSRANEVANHLASCFPSCTIQAGSNDLAGFDLVVNATPLGMEPSDPLPVDATQIEPNMLIAEIVMKQETTPLLAAAIARGCRIVRGREMLIEQVPLYLSFFGLNINKETPMEKFAAIAQ